MGDHRTWTVENKTIKIRGTTKAQKEKWVTSQTRGGGVDRREHMYETGNETMKFGGGVSQVRNDTHTKSQVNNTKQ